MQKVNYLLGDGTFAVVTVAVQPQKARETHGEGSKADGPDQSNQVVKNWDCLGEDERNGTKQNSAGHPGSPMNNRVGLQMAGFAQDTHKDVFSGNLIRKVSFEKSGQAGNANM